MASKTDTLTPPLTTVGIDIGKDVFHIVGFGEDGQIAFRRKIRRLALAGTGEAFERGRDFGAWLGLVPRQYSTGGRPILGRISKRGSRYLRTLFIQAANVILMRPHNWQKFSFGPWLEQAALRLHRNKLATALANKLARIAWSVLRHARPFDTHQHEASAI